MHKAVEARIEAGELRRIVEKLESFRSHPLGFRVAGTPAEQQAADWIAAEMRAIGLHDVVLDPVPVDGWELREAHVEAGGTRYECSSFGGVPGTPPGGVAGELVAVSRGGRRELEGIDVTGRIVLLDWRDDDLWPFQSGLELGLRGAAALIVTCQPGRAVLPGGRRAGRVRRAVACGRPTDGDDSQGGCSLARSSRRRGASSSRRPPDPGRRRGERGRFPAGTPHRTARSRWRAPRRVVHGLVRRRDGGGCHARPRAGVRRGGRPATPPDRIPLPYRRGVRPCGQPLRLVHRRLAPDHPRPPGVGCAGTVLSQHRRLRAPRAARGRCTPRARSLGSPRLPAGRARRAPTPRLPPGRAQHPDRDLDVPRRRRARPQRVVLLAVLDPHRLPHAARLRRRGGLRLSGSPDPRVLAAPTRGGRRPGCDPRLRRTGGRRPQSGAPTEPDACASQARTLALTARRPFDPGGVHAARTRALRARCERDPAISPRAAGA